MLYIHFCYSSKVPTPTKAKDTDDMSAHSTPHDTAAQVHISLHCTTASS